MHYQTCVLFCGMWCVYRVGGNTVRWMGFYLKKHLVVMSDNNYYR